MKPVEFKDQTQILGKPSNMKYEQCSSLPVKQHAHDIEGDKFNAFDSVWELTDEEIIVLMVTKRIRLRVIASGMPPVNLMVEPKEESMSDEFVSDVNGALEKGENVFDPNTKLWPESTSVARTTLIPEESILEVEFRSGKTYHYKNFPAILFPDVVEAKSIGQFINKNVKGQFEELEIINN